MTEPGRDERRTSRCEACGDALSSSGSVVLLRAGELELQLGLCAHHGTALGAHVLSWLAEQKSTGPSSMQGRRLADHERTDVIRRWARGAGLPVSSRGSLSRLVVEAFRTAQDARPAEDAPVPPRASA